MTTTTRTTFNFDQFTEQCFALNSGDDEGFNRLAHQLVLLHQECNSVYRAYTNLLGRSQTLPFLPIALFKSHQVLLSGYPQTITFHSSGTTGSVTSRHSLPDPALYRRVLLAIFQQFYGHPSAYNFVFLLPSYLERSNSSLVWMCQELARESGKDVDSCFYLGREQDLRQQFTKNQSKPTFLMGVTFALLQLAQDPFPMPTGTIVMETGGMKGRGPELTREEVHQRLRKAFGIETIHSEYGMTELTSQAYSKGKGLFELPPWMRLVVRDPEDPLTVLPKGRRGAVSIIDLMNMYTAPFIATDDIGIVHENGNFELLGRLDHADIRGCNLLVAER